MNQEIINFSLQTHIFSGFIAIFMFWTVIFMRKGTQLHKKIGTIYFLSMNVVVISSILNCMYYIHEELTTGSANKGGRYT